jgi:hypothetical protein
MDANKGTAADCLARAKQYLAAGDLVKAKKVPLPFYRPLVPLMGIRLLKHRFHFHMDSELGFESTASSFV